MTDVCNYVGNNTTSHGFCLDLKSFIIVLERDRPCYKSV